MQIDHGPIFFHILILMDSKGSDQTYFLTWTKTCTQLEDEIADIKNSTGIDVFLKNRDTRGGGVGILSRSDKIILKKFEVP